MSSKFSIGDIVQLKSGGPKMTIKKVTEGFDEEPIQCQWFSGSKLQNGWFRPESIMRVDESDE